MKKFILNNIIGTLLLIATSIMGAISFWLLILEGNTFFFFATAVFATMSVMNYFFMESESKQKSLEERWMDEQLEEMFSKNNKGSK